MLVSGPDPLKIKANTEMKITRLKLVFLLHMKYRRAQNESNGSANTSNNSQAHAHSMTFAQERKKERIPLFNSTKNSHYAICTQMIPIHSNAVLCVPY